MNSLRMLVALPVALVISLLSTSALAEQKSITYTTKMGPVLSRTVLAPGDRPDHELSQTVRQDSTSSSDADWNNAPVVVHGQSDLVAGTATVSGYAVRTHKSGDQTFYRYQGKLKAVGDGSARQTTGEGVVELIGGTGKFAKAKGSGTWSSAKGQTTIRLDVSY